MFCSKCGKKLETSEIFCSQCGQRVEPQTDSRNRKKSIIIGIIVIAIVVVVVITGIVLLCLRNKEQKVLETSKGSPAAETVQPVQETVQPTEEPTEPPEEKEQSVVVTDQMKNELEPLMEETNYFFYLLMETERIKDSDLIRTMMVYYNLQYRDGDIDFSEKEENAKPKVETELWNLFGETCKYELKYDETYPGYLYVKENGNVRYNGGDLGECTPCGKTVSVVKTGTDQYRLVRRVGAKSTETGETFWYRKVTCDIVKNSSGKYGYNITAFREYRKGDAKAD